jgi:tetratricopeptide (TPR) repeat protein
LAPVFVRVALIVGCLLAFLAGTNLTASGGAAEASCAAGDSALERADPAAAEAVYRDVMEGEPSSTCAVAGFNRARATIHAEERLCAEAKALAAKGDAAGAKAKYSAALAKNTKSECATKGVAPPPGPEAKETKGFWEKLETKLKAIVTIAGLIFGAALVALGVPALVIFAVRRWHRASLAIEPFGNDGIEVKAGPVVAGLVRKRLSELAARNRQSSGSIKLDFVVADVELLAENDSLGDALGGLADISQFKLVVALLDLIDRNSKRRMVAKGELAAAGAEGSGIVLSLQSGGKGVRASGAIWDKIPAADSKQSGPYYKLAERAAAWLQYETARGLEANVGDMTRDAESFSLTAEALAKQRLERDKEAAKTYRHALEKDPENVAALVNLGMLMARLYGDYRAAIGLLGLAGTALRARYDEKEKK